MPLTFHYIEHSDDPAQTSITIYVDGVPHGAPGTHPLFDDILAKARAKDESAVDLINIAETAARTMLSDRVTYAYNRLFFDGDEIDNSLSSHIVRLLGAQDESATAFVNLLENIHQNPNENSVEHLYRHLNSHDFTITEDGMIVGYKAVLISSNVGETTYRSMTSGPAIVDGVPHKDGAVPNNIGSVITMPRSEVTFDPNQPCSNGLHVASWAYVQAQYGGYTVLEVHVHPRDVVSVPNDHGDGKVRVCRYKVVGVVTEPYSEPVLFQELGSEVPSLVIPLDGHKLFDVDVQSFIDPIELIEDEAPEPKFPSPKAFRTMRERAKKNRKGFVRYATTVGRWSLMDEDDPSNRLSWNVNPV